MPLKSRAIRLCLVAGLGILFGGCATLPQQTPAQQETAWSVVKLARSLAGKPYRYGGQSPAGFDCSGFVRYVFKHAAGVVLPHSSRRQFAKTQPVPLGWERPGDLLFFSLDAPGPSHVGIYLGQGQFIHAPSSGNVVRITDANEAYWRRHFVGVRRVL